MSVRYVGLSETGEKYYLFESDKSTKFRQVLWGDFLSVESEEPGGWLKVIWARNSPEHRKELFIPKKHTVETRPLEIIFVDVGQGDGAVLVTPETGAEERIVVIDAGLGDNMARFLGARFKTYRGFDFDAAVITHPDKDHYLGFKQVFANHNVGFRMVYGNGFAERPVSGKFPKLGGLKTDAATGVRYVTDLAEDSDAIEEHFGDKDRNGSFVFPGVMHAALENPKISNFGMLSTEHGTQEDGRTFMPGFAPSDDRGYTIEVLGPVLERDAQGKPRLRKIGDYGETKNGHSVLLRLEYGDFKILFGGDLNDKAEKFLLTHYAGIDDFPSKGSQRYKDMIADASKTFRADIMKVCHHGSEKVTDAFLATVNPAAFIISSGDAEGHVHPRPDLLGRLGRFGRGHAPVLLSTELQRSTREVEDQEVVDKLKRDIAKLPDVSEDDRDDAMEDLAQRVQNLARTNVSVYGAIYLKTDGERLITAFRIETDSATKRWFHFEYHFNDDGELELVDHGGH